jgi:hypothetical protein
MSSFIKLTRRITTEPDGSFRLRAWVSETSDGIPNYVFVYQLLPQLPNVEGQEMGFVHVATYSDMLVRPQDIAEEGSPFFRMPYVDLSFKSLVVLHDKWKKLRRHVGTLVEDIVKTNGLPPAEIVVLELD